MLAIAVDPTVTIPDEFLEDWEINIKDERGHFLYHEEGSLSCPFGDAPGLKAWLEALDPATYFAIENDGRLNLYGDGWESNQFGLEPVMYAEPLQCRLLKWVFCMLIAEAEDKQTREQIMDVLDMVVAILRNKGCPIE